MQWSPLFLGELIKSVFIIWNICSEILSLRWCNSTINVWTEYLITWKKTVIPPSRLQRTTEKYIFILSNQYEHCFLGGGGGWGGVHSSSKTTYSTDQNRQVQYYFSPRIQSLHFPNALSFKGKWTECHLVHRALWHDALEGECKLNQMLLKPEAVKPLVGFLFTPFSISLCLKVTDELLLERTHYICVYLHACKQFAPICTTRWADLCVTLKLMSQNLD